MLLAWLTAVPGRRDCKPGSSGRRKPALTFVKTVDGRFLSKTFQSLSLRALCPESAGNVALLSRQMWQTLRVDEVLLSHKF